MSVLDLARADIRALQPYSSARAESGMAQTMLNANEAPWPPFGACTASAWNRYPDPQPPALLERLSALYGVDRGQVLIGRGSDEAIDLLVRAFCRNGNDAIAICPPTFGMYAVCAAVQGATLIKVPLRDDFTVDVAALVERLPAAVKLVFLCSPNNPTGGCSALADMERIAVALRDRALLVIDEAYIEFADCPSATTLLARHDNVGVLRTLSKAWALAGVRVGCLIAHAGVVALLRRIMSPYPLPSPCAVAALTALSDDGVALTRERIAMVLTERARMARALARLPGVVAILPSRANFLCVRFTDAPRAHRGLLDNGVVVRDVSRHVALRGCLRISIGTPEENARVLDVLAREGLAA
jgi:histidinol-phosphate aminotransferase